MQVPYQRWSIRLLKLVLGSFLVLIVACFVFDQLVQFRMSDAALRTFFKTHHLPAQIHYYEAGGRTIRYVAVGNDSLPTLLFIHGAPSSLSVYTDYFTDSVLLKNFKMYVVDRPGYGYSGFGDPEPSIQKQATLIRPILDSLNRVHHPVLVFGGSYGSSIACRLAMDYPQLVDGLILIGPSLKPGAEKIFWFTYSIEHPVLHWFIPRMFQSANTEKIHHRDELKTMLPYWKNIRTPVAYIQGERDGLIDTSNAGFARQQLVHASYLDITFLKGKPHFIAFAAHPIVREKALHMLQVAEASRR